MGIFHHVPLQSALDSVASRLEGLSHAEATQRLAQHGPNRLTPANRRGPLLRFLLQFHNVLIYVLLASAGVTAMLAHWVDTSVIVGVVVINALLFLFVGRLVDGFHVAGFWPAGWGALVVSVTNLVLSGFTRGTARAGTPPPAVKKKPDDVIDI